MPQILSPAELGRAVSILTQVLQQENVTFGIIGGAACCLLAAANQLPKRGTEDIDLIIQPDSARNLDAEKLSNKLFTDHPQCFAKKIHQYGIALPAVRILSDNGEEVLVDIEMFDFEVWKGRTQYDLTKPDNDRISLAVENTTTLVLSPRWLLREKILSQQQRQGSSKEATDLQDIMTLLMLVQPKSLTLGSDIRVNALKSLLSKRPDLEEALKAAIECPEVFNKA